MILLGVAIVFLTYLVYSSTKNMNSLDAFLTLVILALYAFLWVLGIVSLFLSRRFRGFKKMIVWIAGIVLILFAMGMTSVFVSRLVLTSLH